MEGKSDFISICDFMEDISACTEDVKSVEGKMIHWNSKTDHGNTQNWSFILRWSQF